MNMTSSARSSRKSSLLTIVPSVSRRRNAGAGVPSSSIVDGVCAMSFLRIFCAVYRWATYAGACDTGSTTFRPATEPVRATALGRGSASAAVPLDILWEGPYSPNERLWEDDDEGGSAAGHARHADPEGADGGAA